MWPGFSRTPVPGWFGHYHSILPTNSLYCLHQLESILLQPKELLPRPFPVYRGGKAKQRSQELVLGTLMSGDTQAAARSLGQFSALLPFRISLRTQGSNPRCFWNHKEKCCYSSTTSFLKHTLQSVVLESAFPTSIVFASFLYNPCHGVARPWPLTLLLLDTSKRVLAVYIGLQPRSSHSFVHSLHCLPFVLVIWPTCEPQKQVIFSDTHQCPVWFL
jgi:hypothetical protein